MSKGFLYIFCCYFWQEFVAEIMNLTMMTLTVLMLVVVVLEEAEEGEQGSGIMRGVTIVKVIIVV